MIGYLVVGQFVGFGRILDLGLTQAAEAEKTKISGACCIKSRKKRYF
jgi:hypothetical protein